jgi:hypothetical protein
MRDLPLDKNRKTIEDSFSFDPASESSHLGLFEVRCTTPLESRGRLAESHQSSSLGGSAKQL